MLNIRKILGDEDVPLLAKLHNRVAGSALSVTLALGLLSAGAVFADADEAIVAAGYPTFSNVSFEAVDAQVVFVSSIVAEIDQDITQMPLWLRPNGAEYPITADVDIIYQDSYNMPLWLYPNNAEYPIILEDAPSYTEPEYDPEYLPAEAEGYHEYIPVGGMPAYIMYLTFDDGPTRHVTPIILDILAERDIQATFFVIGRNVRANPDIMQRIVDEGHTIGIHSDCHDYGVMYASLEAFINDVVTTRELIAEFTGYLPDIYRFPGGSVTRFNERIRRDAITFLDEHEIVYFDWNASIDDSIGGNRTPAQLLARGLETARGDHVIMLAHDTQPATAEMIAEMIDIFAETYLFDVLTSDVEPVQMGRR